MPIISKKKPVIKKKNSKPVEEEILEEDDIIEDEEFDEEIDEDDEDIEEDDSDDEESDEDEDSDDDSEDDDDEESDEDEDSDDDSEDDDDEESDEDEDEDSDDDSEDDDDEESDEDEEEEPKRKKSVKKAVAKKSSGKKTAEEKKAFVKPSKINFEEGKQLKIDDFVKLVSNKLIENGFNPSSLKEVRNMVESIGEALKETTENKMSVRVPGINMLIQVKKVGARISSPPNAKDGLLSYAAPHHIIKAKQISVEPVEDYIHAGTIDTKAWTFKSGKKSIKLSPDLVYKGKDKYGWNGGSKPAAKKETSSAPVKKVLKKKKK